MRRRRGRGRLDLDALACEHRALAAHVGQTTISLGVAPWTPAQEARGLERELRNCLAHPAVIDLVLFGSQARGGTTGFSDVDAILVIDDAAAGEPATLRGLRRRVISAQRAVVSFQPMQHHGFEVVTPKLLSRANNALGMPASALSETRSLIGHGAEATFTAALPDEGRKRLAALIENTAGVPRWPRQAWRLHGLVSMFELLPALYLQALGETVPKWRSFEEARRHFGEAWWPYDVLKQVRDTWPRISAPGLWAAAKILRNPWFPIAVWSRLPTREPRVAHGLLSSDCLAALQQLALEMGERAR